MATESKSVAGGLGEPKARRLCSFSQNVFLVHSEFGGDLIIGCFAFVLGRRAARIGRYGITILTAHHTAPSVAGQSMLPLRWYGPYAK